MTLLELNDKEKDLFVNWLDQREQVVSEELNLLKNLRQKIEKLPEVKTKPDVELHREIKTKSFDAKSENDSLSWVETLKKELQHFARPVPSGEIVKRLLQKEPFQQKGKRFVTKAVTSKLWLLQERGEVIKEKEDGKFVYSLKKR